MENFQSTLNRWKKTNSIISAIGFISYDIKNILYKHINFNAPQSDLPYLWFGKPKIIKEFALDRDESKSSVNLQETKALPGLEQYISDIGKIKDYLKNGDVYQINYTQPIHYITSNDSFSLFSKLIKLSTKCVCFIMEV